MKTLRLSIAAFLLLAVFSCKKDNNSSSASVTSDQAADIAASSLASNSYGVTSMTDAVASNAQGLASIGSSQSVNSLGVSEHHQECGTTLTDSATFSGSSSSVTFDYFVKYSHTLNCNVNAQPDNIVNALTYHGNFDGPRVTTAATGTANATIAGLTAGATNFVINGEYKRQGSFTSKVGNKASGNSDIDIVVTNLLLSKPGRHIVSGTATITVTGSTSKGGSFSYTGNLLFNGDGTATLTVTGGASYVINLDSGDCKKH